MKLGSLKTSLKSVFLTAAGVLVAGGILYWANMYEVPGAAQSRNGLGGGFF